MGFGETKLGPRSEAASPMKSGHFATVGYIQHHSTISQLICAEYHCHFVGVDEADSCSKLVAAMALAGGMAATKSFGTRNTGNQPLAIALNTPTLRNISSPLDKGLLGWVQAELE